MATILIIDDATFECETLTALLQARGHRVVAVRTGRNVESILEAESPDLVVLELGLVDPPGLAVLRTIRRHSAGQDTAVFVLSRVRDRETIQDAVALGVSDCMLKGEFSLAKFSQRLERSLQLGTRSRTHRRGQGDSHEPGPGSVDEPSAERDARTPSDRLRELRPIVNRSEMDDLLAGVGELRALSPTVAEIMKLTQSEGVPVEKVARAARRDHAVALKLLKLANSASYSRGRSVDSVDQAVIRIGMKAVRQALLNITVIDTFSSETTVEQVQPQLFWEHDIACGVIASELARAVGGPEPESAFTAGVLHDVGRVVYAELLGDRYAQVFREARSLQLPVEQVESRLLLINHADAMDQILRAWRFPPELIDPIVFHHLSIGNIRQIAPRRMQEVAILALANRLSLALLLGSAGNETIYPTEEFCSALKLTPPVITRIERSVRDQTDEIKFAMLQTSGEEGWPEFRDEFQRTLGTPFRPLYVSESPESDAYRIFCDQIRAQDDEPPNVGVVHVAHTSQRESLTERYLRAESEASVGELPVVVLSPKADLRLGPAAARSVCCTLPTPLAMGRFREAVITAIGTDR